MNLKRLFLTIILIFITNNLSLSQNNRIVIAGDLELQPITSNCYRHISYNEMDAYGRVPANGLVYVVQRQALVIDTPWNDDQTKRLFQWLTDSIKVTIKGVIPTHWHVDCMGGLKAVHEMGIPTYAHNLTLKITAEKELPVPKIGFQDSLEIPIGDKTVKCRFLGGGHTVDNFVIWIPEEKILFGGCMIKSLNARNPGFTGDGDLAAYPVTLKKVLNTFPEAKIVIPGHGRPGSLDLVKHTLDLLTDQANR